MNFMCTSSVEVFPFHGWTLLSFRDHTQTHHTR